MAEYREVDLRMVEIYRDMLPKKLFDAHMHIYGEGTIPNFFGKVPPYQRPFITADDYSKDLRAAIPGVELIRLNTIPTPDPCIADEPEKIREKMISHVAKDAIKHPENVFSGYVLPTDTEEKIEEIASLGARALKCYCYSVKTKDHNSLKIGEFLPETSFPILEKHKIPVIIHMMRNALEDEENFNYIESMAKKHPDAKIVLAHCARSFASYTAVNNLKRLSGLDNIWIDISAINEPASIMASLKFSRKKTVYGTDYPVCLYRGRAFSFADKFMWLIEDMVPKGYESAYMITEELLAIYQSALLLDLDATEIEDLFYNNAIKLFGVK